MDWTLDKSRSICRQLCEKLCVAIAAGELKAGQRLFSVREVALLAAVTPNTVQKSFEELERMGILHSVPYSGWYVSENTEAARREVELLRMKNAREYLLSMERLGTTAEEAIHYLNQHCQGKECAP